MSGRLKHTGVVTQLIRKARGENKGNLTVLWLDLPNAYAPSLTSQCNTLC